MAGPEEDDLPRLEDLHDPTGKVDEIFRRAVAEPFGRHIRAIERFWASEVPAGLVRIHVDPTDAEAPGWGSLVISPLFVDVDMPAPVPVEAFIVYGVRGLHVLPTGSFDYTFGQAEKQNLLAVRLAVAHELGHLALGHAYEDGALRVPDGDFTAAQDWEASAYAIYLLRLTGRYLARRRKLLIPYRSSVRDWVGEEWPKFAKHPIRLQFEGFMARRRIPWPTMTEEQINDFRMGR